MPRDVKRQKLIAANTQKNGVRAVSVAEQTLKINELRRLMLGMIPHQTIGQIGMLSKDWKRIIDNEPIDLKQEVEKYLGYGGLSYSETCHYHTLLNKNNHFKQLKDDPRQKNWLTVLNFLFYRNLDPCMLAAVDLSPQIIVRTLVSLNPKLATIFCNISYAIYYLDYRDRSDIPATDANTGWEKLLYVFWTHDVNLIDTVSTESTLAHLMENEQDNYLKKRLTACILTTTAALSKQWKKMLDNAKLAISVNLHNIHLTDAPLENIHLVRPRLKKTTFTNTNMNNAILEDADLSEVTMEKSNFAGAQLKSICMRSARATDCDFSATDCYNGCFEGTNLIRVNFANSNCTQTIFAFATVINAANFSNTQLMGCNAYKSEFIAADFTNADLSLANFNCAILRGSKLTNAILSNASFIGTDLTDVDLTNAKLAGTVLIGAILSSQQREYAQAQGAILSLQQLMQMSHVTAYKTMHKHDVIKYVFNMHYCQAISDQIVHLINQDARRALVKVFDTVYHVLNSVDEALSADAISKKIIPIINGWLDKYDTARCPYNPNTRHSPRFFNPNLFATTMALKDFLNGCKALETPALSTTISMRSNNDS